MDPAVLALGAIALALVVLILLAVRKLAKGRLEEGERVEELPAAPETADLEAEALAAGEPAAEAPVEPEKPEGAPQQAQRAASGTRAEADERANRAMQRGLEKTRTGFMSKLNDLLFKRGLDAGLADELEALLVTSDIGIRTAEKLLGDLREELSRAEIKNAEAVRTRLREKVLSMLAIERADLTWDRSPTVVMVIGVNGVGKTTTIGKLAGRLTREGKVVVLAAGDTFRAAAVEQLEIWGERAGATVVKGAEHADPASVVYDAIQRAKSIGAHACICDTAGRLHTKVNLMEELKKLRRVMDKAMPGAPHEVLLVLDATTGQNAITQAKQFKEAVEVTALALTKLDGTAKGGVVVAICDELALPVRYVGIGEKIEDLRNFDAVEFTDALFLREGAEGAAA